MKYGIFIFLIFLTFSANSVAAQDQPPKDDLENPFQIVNKYIKQNNYITPIFELKSKEDKYLASPVWKSAYLEMIVLLYGYVGDYREAYRYDAMLFENFPAAKQIREMYKQDVTDIKTSPKSRVSEILRWFNFSRGKTLCKMRV